MVQKMVWFVIECRSDVRIYFLPRDREFMSLLRVRIVRDGVVIQYHRFWGGCSLGVVVLSNVYTQATVATLKASFGQESR